MATTVHLVRHAAHGLLGRVLTGRLPSIPLSPAGQEQAERLAEHFASLPLRGVISSPLERARATAQPIADRHGLDVLVENDFTEIDFGEWTGQEFDALHARPDWQAWNRLRSLALPPGGEGMLQAQSRALAALAHLRRAHPDGDVVVVSHADVLKAILAHVLGIPIDLMQRVELDPASRSSVVFSNDDLRVLSVNLPV